VYVCVYAHTHTHCTDVVLECEPRGRKRHLEGLKNPDGLNLGIYVFVYVYKAGMDRCRDETHGKVSRCGTPRGERR